MIVWTAAAMAQQAGSIRGMVYDADFEAPLALAEVKIAETDQKVQTTEQGNYVIGEVKPGAYTLIFSKDGYTRKVKANVVVNPGQLTEVDESLSGEFTDMEEFIVQDLQIGGATEVGLLNLRFEAPALLDSIGSDLMSRAGASDVAAALNLVSGATVQDGKYAVVRGLPDRYVNSQMNGVRLPSADPDVRAVQLDQFPSPIVESIQISKTFTPDQQGDASGGAVNVVLKGIPDENFFSMSSQYSVNSQVAEAGGDFLSYKGGGLSYFGFDDADREIQYDNIGANWDGAAGVSETDAPIDYKWNIAGGGRHTFENDVTIGGFASVFYKRDSSHYDNGVNDRYWVDGGPGTPLTPELVQDQGGGDFKTSLYDVTKSQQEVQWGALGTLGVETEHHKLNFTYLYTHDATDTATLSEDTRGKQYFFPGHNPDDPSTPGHDDPSTAPYLRTETLKYTERTTKTLQFHGEHALPIDPIKVSDHFTLLPPEMDWTLAFSSSILDEPDKRQFGELWTPEREVIPGFVLPARHSQFKPGPTFILGNYQRVFKYISEDSDQYFLNFKLPFEQWTGDKGYVKFGLFDDQVTRYYNQDSFSNFNDNAAQLLADWEVRWSEFFPSQNHPLSGGPPFVDVDYDGEQSISAWYYMVDLPLTSWFKLIGGARFESTRIGITVYPEADATWVPPGASSAQALNAGDADVNFQQDDVLPSIGFVFNPVEWITLRGSYTETVARQTFKELTPVQQQEYLGADIFIGNPELGMSALKNYDLRLDYKPYDGGLFSVSYFFKDITDPIEYEQRIVNYAYTTAFNYPEGQISGFEFETRQQLGYFWDELEGLAIGANATLIDSEVTLPTDTPQATGNILATMGFPIETRNMTNAPEYLYNFNITYDVETTGTQLGLFYTVRGDTLIAGAGQSDGNFIPSVYEAEYGTLNFSISQKIGEYLKLTFQAKNLTNPDIQEVYRSKYLDGDTVKNSYTKGIDFSISLSAKIPF